MIIGSCMIELRLFEINSIKEKRQVVKSLIGRIQSRYNVSISEVENQELWGVAVIGFACVTTTVKHANQMINSVVKFIDGDSRIEIIDHTVEIL